ncbi:MAG: cation:proton antiporter [Methanosarcinales archaeon]|nr:MAG: cation:proton antiporter [Methanosarcinales archaeon]
MSELGTIILLFTIYLAKAFGLHAVIGRFMGGAALSGVPLAKIEDVQSKVSSSSYGIFVPIFFALIGLSVDFGAIAGARLFTLIVVVMALAGKLIRGFIVAKAVGFDSRDSLIFGVGVMPRAGIELVVISVGRSMGIIDDQVFSAIVLMIAVSGIVTPLLKFAALIVYEPRLRGIYEIHFTEHHHTRHRPLHDSLSSMNIADRMFLFLRICWFH